MVGVHVVCPLTVYVLPITNEQMPNLPPLAIRNEAEDPQAEGRMRERPRATLRGEDEGLSLRGERSMCRANQLTYPSSTDPVVWP